MSHSVTFRIGDTADSEAIPVSGFCSVRYQQAGGDDASLYAVTTADTAASSGTLIGAFTASTTTATTFTAGTRWVKAVATDATAGGSVMTIDCAPLTGSGSGGSFSVASYGAQADGTTNDTAAINRAIDAACDAGGGVVFFPEGTYAVGSTGAGAFYSGIQVTCSDVTLLGVPGASEIIPLFTNGGSLLNVCPAFTNTPNYGADEDCASAANISNVRIEGLRFYDADSSLTCNNYNAGRGCCGNSANSSCTSGHEEESHGIFVSDCDNCAIIGNEIEGIGDEGIVFRGTTGGMIAENDISNTPSIRGAAGSAISVTGTNVTVSRNRVHGILADPHGDAGNCTTLCNNKGAAIAVGSSSSNIVVADNTAYDIDADFGVQIYAGSGATTDITVSGNTVEMDDIATYSCQETPAYPGTPSRCSVWVAGAAGTPTRDAILISGNSLTGGIVSSNVDALGSVTISGNTIAGDEGHGLQVAGAPLTIEGNTIQAFDDHAIFVAGLEDDDRTESVLIANNNLFENNKDATDEQTIYGYEPASPCGTDGLVKGGVSVIGNVIQGSGVATSMGTGIQFTTCAKASVIDNLIDFRGGAETTASGINNAATIKGNIIRGAGLYGIVTTVSGGVISGNTIEASANRGIFANGANDVLITNNLIHGNIASFAIDASGQRPICLGNISKSDDGSDRTILCGETAPSGAGCSADGADAGGLCGFNQVCNTGDTGC